MSQQPISQENVERKSSWLERSLLTLHLLPGGSSLKFTIDMLQDITREDYSLLDSPYGKPEVFLDFAPYVLADFAKLLVMGTAFEMYMNYQHDVQRELRQYLNSLKELKQLQQHPF